MALLPGSLLVISDTVVRVTQALKEKQGKKSKKVIQDVTTRWNSTFYVLERLLELRMAITAVCPTRLSAGQQMQS